ncbi:Gfo/Idh/MocA family oxidoreductase [Methylobacterium sp. J-030]|uniref:Gfo/Idh/MocA family protein n=1 Tax=Methylobacterium sp. J-030 TaxID=2836627 RepID=UPI001FBBF87F|nr:Gfo/Idh/MocA family oxidoreductase [Methylobacterium sp. J-030]MCJ2071330.1 Gfo/Idh/MocA family oxidoreductase [Methylobacterium sp. J-030]
MHRAISFNGSFHPSELIARIGTRHTRREVAEESNTMRDGAVRERKIRIGIVGATPRRGWAGSAHVPALQAIPSLTLHAVATRSEASARIAAEAFGAPLWFGDPAAMIEYEEVDAVVIAVKAPDHFGLVRQALLCGKPVYCEWPFGRTVEEARTLDALARDRNVATAVGLQGRFSPWLRQARDLVVTGRLGRILSTSLLAYDELSVGSVDEGNAYLLDAANGANPLTIHSGHYIDALCFVLGELVTVSAVTAVSKPRVRVRQTGETRTATSPDQIAVCGLLEDGAVASFQMRAGSGDPSFTWEIQGERGVLRISSAGYLMWRPLRLEVWDAETKRWDALPPPDTAEGLGGLGALAEPARNIARAYDAFAADILTGSRSSVTFSDARRRRETVEAARTAAQDGVAKSPLT